MLEETIEVYAFSGYSAGLLLKIATSLIDHRRGLNRTNAISMGSRTK